MKAKSKNWRLFVSTIICLAVFLKMFPVATFAEDDVAEINGTYYATLSSAFNAVPNNTNTTVKLLKDVQENVTVDSNKDIVLNLNEHTLSNATDAAISVIINKGKLEIKNGTITSNVPKNAAINVESNGVLKVSNNIAISHVYGGGDGRQAIYNNGGKVYISDGATLTTTATARAAVHNLNNGTTTIAGGETISNNYHAVYNEKGTVTIGVKDGAVDTATPILQGYKSGLSVKNGAKFNFYDGTIKGKNSAIDLITTLNEQEEYTSLIDGTEVIDGVTYKTKYLEMDVNKIRVGFDPSGGEVSPTYKLINNGDSVGELPTPDRGIYNFEGWFTDPNAGEKVEESTVPDGDVTYYAHWSFVPVAWIGDTGYPTLREAVEASQDGDTIILGEGEYSLYNSGSKISRNNLTFVGQGADKTKWYIGAEVPNPGSTDIQYQADYSLDGSNTIKFKNMTMQLGKSDYLGFTRIDNTEFENCVINGKMEYHGYESAVYKNTTFNCPNKDYCAWTYTAPIITYEGCTFNSSGKIINVYSNANNIGNRDIIVNFKNNTINNTSNDDKAVLNINDATSRNADSKFILNISGVNSVDGITPKAITCSKLFGFSSSASNKGYTVVNIDGTTVWENGQMVSHEIDTANDKYTDGYKDDAYHITKGEWEKPDGVSYYVRTVSKICSYCDYAEQHQEKGYTVTYTDGVDGHEVFEDQVKIVAEGDPTPIFDGSIPLRNGYEFKGLSPNTTERVYENMVYTAIWEKQEEPQPVNPDEEDSSDELELSYTDGSPNESGDLYADDSPDKNNSSIADGSVAQGGNFSHTCDENTSWSVLLGLCTLAIMGVVILYLVDRKIAN